MTTEERRERCPDGGYCHGSTLAAGSPPCLPGSCFRVRSAGPLSGVFPGDRWPDAVLDAHGLRPAERPAHERILIEGEWLVEDVGQHTCGAGGEWPHEPGCGLVPLMPVAELDEQMNARSRFAARILPADEHEETVPVELYAGSRYDYPSGRANPRRPAGVVELNREQAADLVRTLGEPDPMELPEDQRPEPQGWPL